MIKKPLTKVQLEEMDRDLPLVLEKWRNSGLLKDIPENKEMAVAWLLEQQERLKKSLKFGQEEAKFEQR